MNFRQILKDLKWRRPGPRACPQCGSLKVRFSGPLDGLIFPVRYICEECNYAGHMFLEIEKDVDKHEQKTRT